jgi:preprotein translocase subunit SecG
MFTLFIVLHVIFCLFLILVILLQTGKGAGIGAAFGGGSQTVFGPRGAGSFIGKVTGTVAALFMLTSIVLAYQSTSKSGRVAAKAEALKTVESHSESVPLDTPGTGKSESSTEAAKPVDAGAKAAQKPAVEGDTTGQTDEAAAAEEEDKKSLPEGIAEKAASPPGLEKAAKAAPKPKAAVKPKPLKPKAEAPKEAAKPAEEAAPTPKPDDKPAPPETE